MSRTDVDHAAADAVVAHHSELTAALTRRVAALRAAARAGSDAGWRETRQELVSWLRSELLPHAAAEEVAMYPHASAQEPGRLLVDGMLAEHRAIVARIAGRQPAAAGHLLHEHVLASRARAHAASPAGESGRRIRRAR